MAYILIGIVTFALELFWFVQLIDLMSRNDDNFVGKYDKPCWVAILLATNWIGAFAYIAMKPYKAASFSENSQIKNIKARSFQKMPNAPKKCPNCGESFFYNAQSCLSCGWSYDDYVATE